ncbi:hypothetical protein ACFVXQ_15480, partial [Kitasatospora sp. NPDC058263]
HVCSPMFIIVRPEPRRTPFARTSVTSTFRPHREINVNRLAAVVLAAALIVVLAILAAAAAGTLARLDGATYPAAVMRAAATFAAVLALAAAITGAVAQFLA